MYNKIFNLLMITMVFIAGVSCNQTNETPQPNQPTADTWQLADSSYYYDFYADFELKTDLSALSENHKEMLRIMFQVADIMDDIFWKQAYGDKESFLNKFENDKLKTFSTINYGPWDRLNNNISFLKGIGEKPKGAGFYPEDMTVEEFEALNDSNKTSQYTVIRRGDDGQLKVVWYHQEYKAEIDKAAELLKKAAELAEDEGLKKYLNLRAEALLTDDYQASDFAWMEMKNSPIDFVVGPIENYEDHLFGFKAAHESFILIKDIEWSNRLAKFAKFLPAMQKGLPVAAKYKSETPGADADLNAYDVIYYAGDCNAGSKTIAINLPNDPMVQLAKGSRKLQLKNSMKAKFDKILLPIANQLIDESQRNLVSFDAFFANTMFHEVAHGMGIKMVVGNPKLSVREALKDQYTTVEEGKADILGLYLVSQLNQMGEFTNNLEENYVTFMAGIFRSIRFGASSAHGKANMMRFNFFMEKGAVSRNENGTYKIDFQKMKDATIELTKIILQLQGDGDYAKAKEFVDKYSGVGEVLQADLNRLDGVNIPKDIYFIKGPAITGL